MTAQILSKSLKNSAFVPVRLTSKRLPRKHFKKIGGTMLLSWVIERLKSTKLLDDVIICSPDEPESYELVDFAKSAEVELYIHPGDVNDVVGRLTEAAKINNAHICVLASGDCPLLSTSTVDMMIQTLMDDPRGGHIRFADSFSARPIHEGIVVSKRWVWEKSERFSDTKELREHHFPVLLKNLYPEEFKDVKQISLKDKDIFYKLAHRISVDTPDDLKFMGVLYNELAERGYEFNLENVIKLLLEKPHLKDINSGVYQKAVYDKSKLILFALTREQTGHNGFLSKAFESAKILINKYGTGVRFLVENDTSANIIKERGFSSFTAPSGGSLDFDTVVSIQPNNHDYENSFKIEQEDFLNKTPELIAHEIYYGGK